MLEFNGTLIFLAVSFLLFMFVMNKIFYRPITRVREERNSFFEKENTVIVQNKVKSEELTAKHTQKINEARISATTIVADANEKANAKRADVLNSKKSKIQIEIDENKKNIEIEKQEANEELKNQVLSLAQMISSSVLKEEVSISGVNKDLLDLNPKG